MGFLDPLIGGAAVLADPYVWLLVIAGTLFGVVIGAMPGMGITLAFGLALPFTFLMEPVPAVAFLLSISVGGQYGNSLPAILLGLPGSPASALTAIDGYILHKQGKSGLALGITYVAALGGQLVSILFFVAMVVPLSSLAYVFLAPELFALYVFGLIAIVSLSGKNILKGLIAGAFGLLIGLIGLDPLNNTPRFDFGQIELRNGLDTTAVILGLLALSELFVSARQVFAWEKLSATFSATFPSWAQIRPAVPAMLAGTVSGTIIGAIPGASGTAAAMISYQQAQLISKEPEKFGKGSVDGIAANEAAQNASNAGELVPTLGLGVPASGSMVILLSALTLNGLIPGPLLVQESPEMLDASVAGLAAGTIVLLLIGWKMAKLLLRIIMINRSVVLCVAIVAVLLGVYSLSGDIFDVWVCIACGIIGYFMIRYGYSTAAAALAVVLSAGMERTLRQTFNIFDNDITVLVTRPISATILAVALAFLVFGLYRTRKMRRSARADDQGASAHREDVSG